MLGQHSTFLHMYVEEFDGLRGHQTNSIMAAVPDTIGNDAWSSLVEITPVHCRRGRLGTPHVKGLIARGYYAAQ